MRAWIAATILVFHGGSTWGADGSELWRVPLSGARVLEGQDGEILVVGRSSSSSSHIVKLSAGGSLVWRVDLPGVHLNAADRNAAGIIVAVGSIDTTPENSDIFAIAVNDQGSELWRRVIGGISNSEWAGSVRMYADGDAAVGGSLGHNPSLGFNDFAVFKLSGGDGFELWRSIVPSNAGHGGNTSPGRPARPASPCRRSGYLGRIHETMAPPADAQQPRAGPGHLGIGFRRNGPSREGPPPSVEPARGACTVEVGGRRARRTTALREVTASVQ